MTVTRNHPSGFALLIVLWTLSLLAFVGSQVLAAGRGAAQIGRNLVDSTIKEAAADGAVQRAIFELLARRWAADGAAHIVRFGAVAVLIRVADEGGKVNPNVASETLLEALLVQVGAEPDAARALAAAIVGWRTQAADAVTGGAARTQFVVAGRDYEAPGTNFRSIDELGYVRGMTPDLLIALRPHLTVFTDSDPNGATSDMVVAEALANGGRGIRSDARVLQVVTVTAAVQGNGGGAFSERVIVRLNAQTDRHPYERLAIERSPL